MSWDRERLSCCFILCQAGSSQAELFHASRLASPSWGSLAVLGDHSNSQCSECCPVTVLVEQGPSPCECHPFPEQLNPSR